MAKRTKKLIETNQESGDIRVNKYLSDAGICSRRDADKYISAGEVTVDGVTAEMGTKVQPGQVVLLKGKPVMLDEHLVLIALNKPRGIVCTTDRREKDNIIDFLNYGKRIYPIGRLDKESEGLILLTNDGNIVNKILRAGNYHEKEYIVTVNKPITAEFLKGMTEGVPILDTVTLPCKIKALSKDTFQIILTQGLNRQIRRMCEYYDYKVLSLKRIRIMNINLGHLQLGGYRNVTEKEIEGLNELMAESVNHPEPLWNSMDESGDSPYRKTNSSRESKSTKVSKTSKVSKYSKSASARSYTNKGKTTQKFKSNIGTNKTEDNNKKYTSDNKYKSDDSNKKFGSDDRYKGEDSKKTFSRDNRYKREDSAKKHYSDSRNNNDDNNKQYTKNDKLGYGSKRETSRDNVKNNYGKGFDKDNTRSLDRSKKDSKSYNSKYDNDRKNDSRSYNSRQENDRKNDSRSYNSRQENERKNDSKSHNSQKSNSKRNDSKMYNTIQLSDRKNDYKKYFKK